MKGKIKEKPSASEVVCEIYCVHVAGKSSHVILKHSRTEL